jgi:hypothetical protein
MLDLKRHLRPWATAADMGAKSKAGAIDERPGCSRTIRRQAPWSELIRSLARDLDSMGLQRATWFKNDDVISESWARGSARGTMDR